MPLSLNIDVTKLKKEWFFEGKNGAKYAEIVVIEKQNGPDNYGNTHMVVQGVPKQFRQDGTQGPILGNGKVFGKHQGQQRPPQRQQRQAPQQNDGWGDGSSDDDQSIPF